MTGWRDAGLCAQVDPELWFPPKGDLGRAARAVCGRCPVRLQCLEWALARRETWGIYGGLSEHERRPLLTARH